MRFIFFILALFIIPFVFVYAENGLPLGFEEQFSVKVTPEKPGPTTPVTIRLDSYSADFNKATISWSVNGKLVTKAIGANVFSFTTGAIGSKTTVSAVITKENGETLERTFIYQPADVHLIFEANTYTPPLYKGKAYVSHHSNYKVVAFPEFTNSNGTIIPAENLIYLWRKDFKPLQNQSGYGKNTLELEGDILSQQVRIDVEVSALNSNIIAKKSLTIDPIEPKAVMYENHPLYGFLFNTALTNNVTLSSVEMIATAFPYYYSTVYREEFGMKYEWKLNGNEIPERETQSSLILRNDTNTEGTANIDLRTTQTTKILQFSDTSFFLNFGQASRF